MAKKDKQDSSKKVWVMVDTISTHRMRYVVEAPADHPEYALDTVTAEQANEFSQDYLGETIVSHRIVSEKEALKVCDQDNEYLTTWTKDMKKEKLFTRVEDGKVTNPQGWQDDDQH